MLEAVNIQGQFLHVSKHTFGNRHPHSENHEVNLNFHNTTFTIGQHLSYKDSQRGLIKGCSVVQLFHKVRSGVCGMCSQSHSAQEIGAYIAAEGNDETTIEDIHLRIRVPDSTRPSRLHPPTSAVSVCLRSECQAA